MNATRITLPYGCNKGLPDNVSVAWGARLIWPADLVWDRQGCAGGEEGCAERLALLDWLGPGGAGDAMREKARSLARSYDLGDDVVTLFEDEVGKIVGSTQGSHGYVYVAAWRHEDVSD